MQCDGCHLESIFLLLFAGEKKSVGYDIKQQLGAEGEEHRGFVHKIIKKNNPMLLRQIGLREEVEGLPPPLDL